MGDGMGVKTVQVANQMYESFLSSDIPESFLSIYLVLVSVVQLGAHFPVSILLPCPYHHDNDDGFCHTTQRMLLQPPVHLQTPVAKQGLPLLQPTKSPIFSKMQHFDFNNLQIQPKLHLHARLMLQNL